jgi:hypothetical protein
VTTLPPLVAEDFACPFCGFAFPDCDVTSVPSRLSELAAEIRSFVGRVGVDRLTAVPPGATWTGVEYLCHIRDVLEASTIRLFRTRTEDRPTLEPLYNDLRAVRFRYADADPLAVLDEIDAAVAGCCDEIAATEDWDRTLTRLPGEQRTARWLARAAVHEAQHHLRDLRAAQTDSPEP